MPEQLPQAVVQALDAFVAAAKAAVGDDLQSFVLYGSAAEGRLRATSDVNAIAVLTRFDPARAAALREPFRVAHAAIHLELMLLLASEIPSAAEAFADKFADIARRRRVLHGPDPFASLVIPRAAEIARLRQSLLNLELRLRNVYVARGLREEQLAIAAADFAGPLRSCAAALVELRGERTASPKEALEKEAASIAGAAEALAATSEAREKRALPPGKAAPAVLKLLEIADVLQRRVAELKP